MNRCAGPGNCRCRLRKAKVFRNTNDIRLNEKIENKQAGLCHIHSAAFTFMRICERIRSRYEIRVKSSLVCCADGLAAFLVNLALRHMLRWHHPWTAISPASATDDRRCIQEEVGPQTCCRFAMRCPLKALYPVPNRAHIRLVLFAASRSAKRPRSEPPAVGQLG